ncbi:Ribosomal RNA large subunit methyltransferase G [BD1-7 clade bacterium]|uniref:Ribosomal RNA large subunit methyltransferase G n=1 Tax=BD1-7 clade bacterium TaxID=2029982 RepID=A0A5S9QLX4_9GAMM|nr:Ribosomal RNA large subunit methyltransferase G [BD1-7 clade bacterium]
MRRPFITALGEFDLAAPSATGRETQQAWNQADAYLVEKTREHDLTGKTVALINEGFGALATALTSHSIKTLSFHDSASYEHWHKRNTTQASTSDTEPQLSVYPLDHLQNEQADIYLIKLPKNIRLFERILSIIAQKPSPTVYVAAMQKHWPAAFYSVAEKYFEKMDVYPGQKKAKCMRLETPKALPLFQHQWEIDAETDGISLINPIGVFSQQQLDIGSRLFLKHFPNLNDANHIIDLGCGNGVLGICALKRMPKLHVDFIDDSRIALDACATNLSHNGLEDSTTTLWHNDCLFGLEFPHVDAILCNPPFHQQHQVSTQVADTMIRQSAEQLKKGGSLFLIGNRHLQYKKTLKRHFSQVTQHASDAKFIIFEAIAG